MHKFIQGMADVFTHLVIVVYLLFGVSAVATFFVGHLIGVNVNFELALSIAAAFAFETHSFVSQRAARVSWVNLNRETDPVKRAAFDRQFKLYFWSTVALIAFSCYNGIAFWALIEHPQNAGDWVTVIMRGVAAPIFFLLAGFLSSVETRNSAADMLADASHAMLHRTIKTTLTQWKKRLKQARKAGTDLAPIAVALMTEEGDHASASRLSIIANALSNAEGVRSIAAPKPAQQPALTVPAKSLRLASTDVASVATMTPPMESDPDALQMEVENGQSKAVTQRASSKGRAAKSNGSSKGARKPYPKKDTRTDAQKEADCRRIITENGGVKNISAYKVAQLADVSTSTASKWWHLVEEGR